ncbi:trihelix transcription factor PTL [Humulus lupulus]|uniref:trihelix transcription factor PTL n=1 Tax=Humulus lupulus TaxID=3486 RepID=UPI002B412899|nr:trihelix transcription factor PTL [Humulus lupulus]
MEMEDQYGMADLRQLMNGTRSHFPAIPQPTELFPGHRPGISPAVQPFEMMMMGGHPVVGPAADIMPRGFHHHHHHQHHQFMRSDSAATSGGASITTITATSAPSLSGGGGGLELAESGGCLGMMDGGTGRWPRQETLTLLEIRSCLDSKFKEANQKGPLWDEVSRIMSEEHGYQRSGKKCREKFENLYKYYKKTKEGKAGRQDGKHYRFFRQLEALYGDTSNHQVSSSSLPEAHFVGNNLRFPTLNTPTSQANNNQLLDQGPYQSHLNKHTCDSLSLSNSSEFESSSSDDNNDFSNAGLVMADNDSSEKMMVMMRRNKKRSGSGGSRWKVKIKEFIDSQMRKLMEKQDTWLEKLMRTLEQKEKERSLREEEWRKQESARIDREHKFWAKERAWIEARDAALMDALHKLTGKEVHYKVSSPEEGLMLAAAAAAAGENNVPVDEGESETQNRDETWPESEVSRLIQFRTSMDSRFEQGGFPEEVLWEDIAAKLACLGYERSGLMCKDKWESINHYVKISNNKESSKKRKENSRSSSGNYFQNNTTTTNENSATTANNNNNNNSLYNHGGVYSCDQMSDHQGAGQTTARLPVNDGSSPSNANVHDSCFPFLMGEGDNLWENYGLKLSKGGQNQ